MKKSILTPPDDFSLSPLLSLLPVKGKVGRLEALTSSLFARYEKVMADLRENDSEKEGTKHRRLSAEGEMLKQVLEWLEVKPG